MNKGDKFASLFWPGSSTEIIEESTLDGFKVNTKVDLCYFVHNEI